MNLTYAIKSQETLRNRIQKDTEEFLKKGGKIELVPNTEFSDNFKPVALTNSLSNIQ